MRRNFLDVPVFGIPDGMQASPFDQAIKFKSATAPP